MRLNVKFRIESSRLSKKVKAKKKKPLQYQKAWLKRNSVKSCMFWTDFVSNEIKLLKGRNLPDSVFEALQLNAGQNKGGEVCLP